jgi:hypothetical protein
MSMTRQPLPSGNSAVPCSSPTVSAQQTCLFAQVFILGLAPLTHLRFPRRKDVDDANARRLAALNSEKKTYFAHDTGGRTDNGTPVSPQTATEMLEKLVAPQQLTLKVGAQVMLVKNLRQGILVNGTLGRVLNFCTPGQARQTSTEISDEQDDQVGTGFLRKEWWSC